MKKRSLFLLLALLCLVGIGFVHQAYAAEVIAGEDYNGFYNVSWQLTDDGVLTVSSPRVLNGNQDSSKMPWAPYTEQISKIVVKAPTQWISENVFAGLYNVEEVILPNSLEVIWTDAFADCVKLKAIEIPDSVEQIEKRAFARCTSLERLKLPNNPKYTEVKEYTFDGCPLTELDIPDPIISIDLGAFSNCTQLRGLRIGTGLQFAIACKFNDAAQLEWAEIYGNVAVQLTGKANLRRVVLGPNAANSVFTDCTALDSVTLQKGLTDLHSGAFEGCTALKSIQLPSTLVNIGDRAFYGCPIEEVQLPHGLLFIGNSAFRDTRLRELTVPATVQELRENALSAITLEKVLFLGDAPQVQDCVMTYAAPAAYYPAGNSTWTEEKMLALGFSAVWESFCPGQKNRVHTFDGWRVVTAPTEEAAGLERRSCSICGTVEERIVQRLESQEPPVTDPTEPTQPAAPTEPAPTEPAPTEPASTEPRSTEPAPQIQSPKQENIIWYAVAAVAVVAAVALGWLLRKKRIALCLLLAVLAAAIAPCAAAAQNQNIHWEYDAATGTASATGQGILTRQGFEERYSGQPLRHLVIGEGIDQIGDGGFMQCMELESVTFPDSLKVIGYSAFEQCYALQRLEFPEGLQILGHRAFYACEQVSSITFGSQLRSVGRDCFGSVGKVTQLQLPDSVLYIGTNAFAGMPALQQVSLGAGLYHLGDGAFFDCASLHSIQVSRDNRHYADHDGVLLTADEKTLLQYPTGRGGEYTVPASVKRIAPYAFYYSSLTAVHIPGTVESIGESAFYGCQSLACVDIAEGVVEIGNSPFLQCFSLWTLTIPASVKHMNASVIEYSELRQLVFLGEKPEQLAPWFYMYDLAVYYPAGDSSWDAIRNEHFDYVRWVPLCAGDHTPVVLPEQAGNCWEKGLTEGLACSQCGLVFRPQKESQLGDHVFAPWQQIRPATETAEGLEERICDICGEKEARPIEKLSPSTPPAPPAPPESSSTGWLVAVIVAVAVCFVGVEFYLLMRKKRKTA